MERHPLPAVLGTALLLALLLSALAAWLLPLATPWFRGLVPVPGLAQPTAYRLDSAAEPPSPDAQGPPGLSCATLVFRGTTYSLIDPAGLTVAQMDMYNFPTGVTDARLVLEREERARDGTRLRRYRYVNEHLGLCTGAFMLWFDGARDLGSRPGLVFWLLWPWAALFAVAAALARLLVDGDRRGAVAAGLLYWPALLATGAAAGTSSLASWLLPWLVPALALKVWHRPRTRAVPVVAVFVVGCLLLHLLINAVLAVWLLASGGLRLHPQFDEQERFREGTIASMQYPIDGVPTPWAAALPTWAEVCPPFRLGVTPIAPR